MVPDFSIPENCEDEGIFEEETCWNNVILQLNWFYNNGFRNIVALDFDDVRTRELPKIFKGYKFVTLKLISSDSKQIETQMIHRHNNEGGLYDIDNVVRSNEKIKNRRLLPNEVLIDVFGKSKEEVFEEVVNIIDNFTVKTDYVYELDDEKNYLSWVKSKNLK